MYGVVDALQRLFAGPFFASIVWFVNLLHQEKILHQRPIVINLQSDIDHPTQSLAGILLVLAQ